jgi:hypothetical protein
VPPDKSRVGTETCTMIAFIQPPEKKSRPPALQRVHRLLVATLLPRQSDPSHSAPPVAGWKAWLLVGWVTIVALWSFTHVIGCLL